MAASFAVRQSKTILAEVGFCDALAAERGGQSATNLDMNTLTLCPFISRLFEHAKRTSGAVKKYDRIFPDQTIIR
jgi:hypothetical protein